MRTLSSGEGIMVEMGVVGVKKICLWSSSSLSFFFHTTACETYIKTFPSSLLFSCSRLLFLVSELMCKSTFEILRQKYGSFIQN